MSGSSCSRKYAKPQTSSKAVNNNGGLGCLIAVIVIIIIVVVVMPALPAILAAL